MNSKYWTSCENKKFWINRQIKPPIERPQKAKAILFLKRSGIHKNAVSMLRDRNLFVVDWNPAVSILHIVHLA